MSPRARHRRSRRWAAASSVLAGIAMTSGLLAADEFAGASIDQMSALAAADSADHLMDAGLDFEALPFIARVERVAGEVDAGFLIRAATAELNAGFQARSLEGLKVPVTRSAVERVDLASRAFLRLERAETISSGPQQRAGAIALRAHQLAVWGFAREGYAEYRRAHQVHPLSPEKLGEVRWIERALRSPTLAPAPGGMP